MYPCPVDRPFGIYPPGDQSRYAIGNTTLRSLVEHVRTDRKLAVLTDRYRRAVDGADDTRHAAYARQSKRSVFRSVAVGGAAVKSPFDEWLPREDAIDPTGLYGFDLDDVEPIINTPAELRDDLFNQFPGCVAAWITASGRGVFVAVAGPVVDGPTHQDVKNAYRSEWTAIGAKLADVTEIAAAVDPAPSNIASLRFVTHDPDARIAGGS